MDSSEIRSTLLSNGWRQGSVIETSVISAQAQKTGLVLPEIFDADDFICIVLNSSCDVVFGKLDELPQVQVVLAKRGSKKTNNKVSDPRKMVLFHSNDKYDVQMQWIFSIDRKLFLEMTPNSTLVANQLNALIRWKVALYNRLTLPESLVCRIGHVLREKPLLAWLKEKSHCLEGVFFEISTLEELSTSETYQVGVICIVNASETTEENNLLSLGQSFSELMVMPLGEIPGIDLLNEGYAEEGIDDVMISGDFTYDMLKRFRRYPFDHFSLDPAHNDTHGPT